MESENYNEYLVKLISNGKNTYIVDVNKDILEKEKYNELIQDLDDVINLDLNRPEINKEDEINKGVNKLKEWLKKEEESPMSEKTNDTMIGGKYKNSKLMKTKKYKGGYRLRRSKKNRK